MYPLILSAVLSASAIPLFGQQIDMRSFVELQKEKEKYVFLQCDSFSVETRIDKVDVFLPSEVTKYFLAQERQQQRSKNVWRSSRRWTNPSKDADFFQSDRARILLCQDSIILDWEEKLTEALVLKPMLEEVSTWSAIVGMHDYFRILGLDVDQFLLKDLGLDSEQVKATPFYKNNIDRRVFSSITETELNKYSPSNNGSGEATGVTFEFSGVDVIRLDESLNLAERILYSDAKTPLYRYVYSDFNSIAGIVFPAKIDVEEFARRPEDPVAWVPKLKLKYTIRVANLAFNTLAVDSIAKLDMPVGTEIVDTVRGVVYSNPASRHAPLDLSKAPQRAISWRQIILLLVAIITAIATIAIVWKQGVKGGSR